MLHVLSVMDKYSLLLIPSVMDKYSLLLVPSVTDKYSLLHVFIVFDGQVQSVLYCLGQTSTVDCVEKILYIYFEQL